MKLKEAYAYNDVSLVPAYSELKSRSEANPEMHGYSLPIIASCMDTLGKEVLSECVKNKLPFICHRSFKSAKEQFEYFMGDPATYYHNYDKCIWFAVGSVQKYQDWIEYLYERGVRRFCVDMAHGDSKACVDTIEFIKNYDIKKKEEAVINGHYETSLGGADIPVHVIAGNVASLSGFKRLQKAGADGVRVGIASGSICFLPDTEVTVRGSGNNIYYRPMQFMSKGDFVLTHKGRIRQVKDVIISDYSGEIYLVNKKTRCTPNHPFYVYNIETQEKSWIPIKDVDLRIHRFISGEDGKQLNNCTINIDEYSGKVYNLTVDEDESYCVGKRRMIVHNCSTQLNCGFGVPILTNIMDISPYKKNTWLIADGGASHIGDIAKAIYFGADFVMTGKMFAATDLALGDCYNRYQEKLNRNARDTTEMSQFACVYPDEFEDKYEIAKSLDKTKKTHRYTERCERNVVKYKSYRGMASRDARKNVMAYASVEGRSGLIDYDCRTSQFINDTKLRLQASLSYGGVTNWKDFRKKVKAVKRSQAGIAAGRTHLNILWDK